MLNQITRTMGGVDLAFPAPTRPLSINAVSNWQAKRRLLKPWKDMAWALAHNALVTAAWPREPHPITVQVVLPFRRANRRDAHNYTGTVVKAVVDGLTQAGLVPDDTPEWVTVLDPEFSIQADKSQPLTATIRIRPRETHP